MINEHTTLGALQTLLSDRGWRLDLSRFENSYRATVSYPQHYAPTVNVNGYGLTPTEAIAEALMRAERMPKWP